MFVVFVVSAGKLAKLKAELREVEDGLVKALADPYEILDSIDISDLPMDDNTPLGDLPHPSTEVPSLHGDPLDVAPLQTLEPEFSFSFDPPIVFTELELDIPRSIRPNTTADHVAQARELVGPDVEVLAPSPGANVTEPPGDGNKEQCINPEGFARFLGLLESIFFI
nr:Pkinase domain-containing protein/PP2C domain-containing protein [Ipomoea batatas]